MDLVFNELSQNYLAKDDVEAGDWMNRFFQITDDLKKRRHKNVYIRTTSEMKGILIAANYTFAMWLNSIKDKDAIRRILNLLTHKPLINKYPYYYYNNISCEGFGIADEEKIYSISYPEQQWPRKINLKKESFDEYKNPVTTFSNIQNFRSTQDVLLFFPIVVFGHHKKHDNRRSNLNDNQSTLEYNIPEENTKVQKLLDCSFGTGKRFAWDKDNGMYLEFQYTGGNVYHGYHITDQTRIPYSVKEQIEAFEKEK